MYSIGIPQSALWVQAAQPIVEFQTSGMCQPKLYELELTAHTTINTTLVVGIGVPAAQGSGIYASRVVIPEDGGQTSYINAITDWQKPPTAPVTFQRRLSLNITGMAFYWRFPRGITIAPNGSYVVWCISLTTTPMTGWFSVSATFES